MADTKISALSSLAAGSIADSDLYVTVDVSDTSMAASGTNKYVLASTLKQYMEALVTLLFGTGTDGDATISSNTTLSADMYYNNLTVNSGITLNTGGYRVFVKGLLTNDGRIGAPGNAASVATGGSALNMTTSGGWAGAGANGGTGAGSQGATPATGDNALAVSGSGGAGGTGSGGSGGATKNYGSNPGVPSGGAKFGYHPLNALLGAGAPGGTNSSGQKVSGGWGGSSGGGDGTNSGGGGGGGGGNVVVAAKRLAGSGSFTAVGGAGGNPAAGNCGGGGGGGGGYIFIVSTATSLGSLTTVVSGGAGGTKTGTGTNGSAGGNGNVYLFLGA